MSKILEAMRKTSAGQADVSLRLRTIDRGNLFPPPSADQMSEFEQLANSLIHLQDGQSGKVVVFASTVSGEGASYVSYNCARYLTLLLDRKVAWIDGNFRNPQAKLAQIRPTFRDLLHDPTGFPPFDEGPEMVVVSNGDRAVKSTDLLNSQRYLDLLKQLQRTFYFTIIDAPAVLGGVEIAHIAEPTLGVVLVIESRRLKHEVIQHGLDQLRKQGVRILGTVLNKRAFHIPEFIYKRL